MFFIVLALVGETLPLLPLAGDGEEGNRGCDFLGGEKMVDYEGESVSEESGIGIGIGIVIGNGNGIRTKQDEEEKEELGD